MNKLQELLEWLSKLDECEIDNLYEVIFNKKLNCIEDIVGKNVYRDFIFEEYELNCESCGCSIYSPILCEDCIKSDEKE